LEPLFITLHRLRNDMIVPSDPAEPIEKAETAEPIEPIERTEPTEPIESTEPREAIDRSESRDHSDNLELVAPASTGRSYFGLTLFESSSQYERHGPTA
jgi:hypothetical protein